MITGISNQCLLPEAELNRYFVQGNAIAGAAPGCSLQGAEPWARSCTWHGRLQDQVAARRGWLCLSPLSPQGQKHPRSGFPFPGPHLPSPSRRVRGDENHVLS